MAINLSKGARVNLAKEAPGLTKVTVGLGWNPNLTDTGTDFDLDASVFMIEENGKVPSEKFDAWCKFLKSRMDAGSSCPTCDTLAKMRKSGGDI